MAKTMLTCANCGFGEEINGKQLKERIGEDGALACSACGAAIPLPEGTKAPAHKKDKPAKKARYAGLEAMTGLDDVIEGEITDESQSGGAQTPPAATPEAPVEAGEENEPPAVEYPKARVYDEPGGDPAPAGAAGANQPDENGSAPRGLAVEAAGAAKETLKKTVRYGRENPLFAAEILDKIFRGIAAGAHDRFDKVAAASVRIGHYTLLGTAALSLIFGVLISLRAFILDPLLTGVTLSALLLFAQYLALRGFELLESYIENNPSRLPGTGLTDILSAVAVLVGLLSLLTGLILTVNYYSPIWLGTAALGLIGGYFGAAALLECGSRLNVSFDASLPVSETIVELVLTGLKAIVAVVPFMFGLGSVAMALCLIWPVVSMLLFSLNAINTAAFFLQESGLLFCAFSPISAYIFILIWAFIIQIARSLLRLAK